MGWRSQGRVSLLAVIALSAFATLIVDAAWREELRQPSVILLGAGAHLSVLVTAGNARVLVVGGNDPVAFGNALAQVIRPTTPRVDVLLVPADGVPLLASSAARELTRARFRAALGELERPPPGATLATASWPEITTARRVRLPDGVEVTAEVEPLGEEPPSRGERRWRVVVRRGGTVVEVLSAGSALGRFAVVPTLSARVVAGREPLLALGDDPPPVFAVADAALRGDAVRARIAEGQPVPTWLVRVHPGNVVRLRMEERGLSVDAAAGERMTAVAGEDTEPRLPPER